MFFVDVVRVCTQKDPKPASLGRAEPLWSFFVVAMVTTRRSATSDRTNTRGQTTSKQSLSSSASKEPAPKTPVKRKQSKQTTPSTSLLSGGSQSSTSRRGLPYHVLLSLALDIEAQGGIKAFKAKGGKKLQKLCDTNPDVYGRVGDNIRRQIGNKVDKWGKFSEKEYISNVLVKFGVLKTDRNVRPTVRSLEESLSEEVSVEQEESSPETKPEPKRVPQPKVEKKEGRIPSVIDTQTVSTQDSSTFALTMADGTEDNPSK